jgi:glycopeptide antibiotics resistance protein
VIAIVATQWPFHYQLTEYAVRQRWHRVDWRWIPRTPAGHFRIDRDFALNLVMLLPLGVGFGVWRRARGVRLVLESLALGIGTSVLLELAQLVTPHRYTTLGDVWRNALGCMVGGLLALYAARRHK